MDTILLTLAFIYVLGAAYSIGRMSDLRAVHRSLHGREMSFASEIVQMLTWPIWFTRYRLALRRLVREERERELRAQDRSAPGEDEAADHCRRYVAASQRHAEELARLLVQMNGCAPVGESERAKRILERMVEVTHAFTRSNQTCTDLSYVLASQNGRGMPNAADHRDAKRALEEIETTIMTLVDKQRRAEERYATEA